MSKVHPQAIRERQELNLRHGIKSSLNHWRQLVASLYLFLQYGGNDFCKEVLSSGKKELLLDDSFSIWLDTNWTSISNAKELVKQCPLFVAQMEPLQVGIELFLKLGKVVFRDSSLSDSIERTGGSRFCKRILFGTNMLVLSNFISVFQESDKVNFIRQWLNNNDDMVIGTAVKKILVTFTEECQYKIRTTSGEIYFQEEGVYEKLRETSNTVESSDVQESVGPFRVLKSFVKEGMHPYLLDSEDGFKIRSLPQDFNSYANMVKATLELIPKRTTIYQEVHSIHTPVTRSRNKLPLQQILYGAPGTGKSFGLNEDAGEREVYRTTFHPDSDYASFVGGYKPTMQGEGELAKIVYSFRPQAFMNAYVAAWKAWTRRDEGEENTVILIVEEINRGNCAQIFGDLFQLLDRSEDGYSNYPVDADADLAKWLAAADQFGPGGLGLERPEAGDFAIKQTDWNAVMKGAKLALPPNLYIWATMNTSDQSLFPIDSAFKRRWEWQYVPIAQPDDPAVVARKIVANGQKYDWWDFISILNAQIADVTKSEDKQLGYFFVKAPKATGEISCKQFANKVLFYLFNDVFKDWELPIKIFGKPIGGKYAFKEFFYDSKTVDGEKTFLPGDVKEAVVAEFIERQEHEGKTVAHEAVSTAD